MTGPTILALDLSLTATGVATWDTNRAAVTNPDGRLSVRTVTTGKLRGHERLARILGEIGGDVRMADPDLVVIEGLYVGQNNNTLALAELHGVVKHYLWAHGAPYVLVPPSTLKVYATGKGNAGKDDVLLAVERRLGHLARPADNNSADALALLALARHAYGHPLTDMPQTHARALSAVAWPELGGHRPIPLTPPTPAAAPKAGRRRDGAVAAQHPSSAVQEALL